jgi:hypothetical protein
VNCCFVQVAKADASVIGFTIAASRRHVERRTSRYHPSSHYKAHPYLGRFTTANSRRLWTKPDLESSVADLGAVQAQSTLVAWPNRLTIMIPTVSSKRLDAIGTLIKYDFRLRKRSANEIKKTYFSSLALGAANAGVTDYPSDMRCAYSVRLRKMGFINRSFQCSDIPFLVQYIIRFLHHVIKPHDVPTPAN